MFFECGLFVFRYVVLYISDGSEHFHKSKDPAVDWLSSGSHLGIFHLNLLICSFGSRVKNIFNVEEGELR